MRPARRWTALALTVGSSLLVGLASGELGLRALTMHPVDGRSNVVPHPALGYTLDPRLPDVDRRGFRNPDDQRADYSIVAIGDSQTQGFGVARDSTWPALLSAATGRRVYNYAVGGYGFPHYHYLLATATRFRPDYVVLGLYPANDVQPKICAKVTPSYYQRLIDEGVATAPCPLPAYLPTSLASPGGHGWLTRNIALASALRAQIVRRRVPRGALAVGPNWIAPRVAAQIDGATDLAQPTVLANFVDTVRMVAAARQALSRANATLGVLILPSNVLVLSRWAERLGIPVQVPWHGEERLAASFESSFRDHGIPFLNATPYVLAACDELASRNEPLYPPLDDHPYAAGQRAYARAALELVRRLDAEGNATPTEPHRSPAGGHPELRR